MGKTLNLRADYVIGFLGAGQLAKMSAQEAFRYGWRVASYSDRFAAEPLQWMTPLSHTGSFEDVDALVAFAEICDVITLENEFLSSEVLHQVVERTGVPIQVQRVLKLWSLNGRKNRPFKQPVFPSHRLRLCRARKTLSLLGRLMDGLLS